MNFALPDLRGRTPIHAGNGHTLGERAGEQAHTLSASELPAHTHPLNVTNNVGAQAPTNMVLAKTGANTYGAPTNLVPMATAILTNVGGSQAHLNMQPFLTLSFCIALQGIFPSQS